MVLQECAKLINNFCCIKWEWMGIFESYSDEWFAGTFVMIGIFRSSGFRWVRYIMTLYVRVFGTYRLEKTDSWARRAFCGELVLGLSGWGRRHWRGPHTERLRVGGRPWGGADGNGIGRWLVVVSFHKWTCSFLFKEVKEIVHPNNEIICSIVTVFLH